MAKVVILYPRLDCSFKEGWVPETRQPIPPIRAHWLNFVSVLAEALFKLGYEIHFVEKPLWQFTSDFVANIAKDYELVFMPHKQRSDFDVAPNLLYYAQTVIPHYFTIDHKGWGANLSYVPMDIDMERLIREDGYIDRIGKFFGDLTLRAKQNISKFEQPEPIEISGKGYDALFVCQLPHDETIKYHSDISVQDALFQTLEQAKANKWRVLVKGHPVNPGSMQPLMELTKAYHNIAEWTDSISIHSAISMCDTIVMVNSGVGFEAMLHNKEIFTFGRSEYQNVVRYKEKLDKAEKHDIVKYQMFLYDFFVERAFDTTNIAQFSINLSNTLNEKR